MRHLIILIITYSAFTIKIATAEDCRFKYWEVIPNNTCKIYYLPNFTFTSVPSLADIPQHIKRFCSDYEIVSKFGKQRSGYCYTGEDDNTGPSFKLGDEKWNFQDQKKEDVYFADLNFRGCVNDKKTTGIVFGVFGWKDAPKDIERSWPLEDRLAKCER